MSSKKPITGSNDGKPTQLDIFGGLRPIPYVTKKPDEDKRLKSFQNSYGKYLTPHVLVLLNGEDDNHPIPKDHAYLAFTEAQQRITVMCNVYGMKRTVADIGLVASGNGKYLYMWTIDDNNNKGRIE